MQRFQCKNQFNIFLTKKSLEVGLIWPGNKTVVPFAWQRECYIGGHCWFSAVCQPFLLVKIDFQYNCRRFQLILRIFWPYMITPGILGGLKDLKDNIGEVNYA